MAELKSYKPYFSGGSYDVTKVPEKNGTTQAFEVAEEEDDVPERGQWDKKIDFILSCVGFAVGLGNVWRFPYLCYKNGGGAFLIPYFICLLCGGVPIFFLEIAIGQFMSEGGLGVWKMCPMFQGIGCATTVIVFLLNIYYIIIIAWAVAYGCFTFTSVLPWSHCNNTYNTENCSLVFNSINASANVTSHLVDPVEEFWERRLLQISPSIEQADGLVWELVLALLFVWVLVYFSVWKGVKWTGKVVYFTATFPYVMLTVLLIRGATLPGARQGIEFYLKPNMTKLQEPQVWVDAGTQIFFSYAIALGAMTALGSYNKFHNNCYRDTIIIAITNSFTSLYAGFAIFSVLGFMAYEQGVDVGDVVKGGPGLAFIAYPKATTLMPVSQLWAFLFFFMILMLGLDSQFVGVEAFVTVGVDMFPNLRKSPKKEIFIALYCLVSFLIGLLMVTRGGMYVFQLFDYYSASGMALLWVCFFESIAIAWFYGGRRFYDNIEMMIGSRINPLFLICWYVLCPLVTAAIFIFMWVDFKPLTYGKDYIYPTYAQALGMCMAFASMICIPGFIIIKLIITPGSLKERFTDLMTPQFSRKVKRVHEEHGKDWRTGRPLIPTIIPAMDIPPMEGTDNQAYI